MKTKIKVITPTITEGLRTLGNIKPLERDDLEITQTIIHTGTASIESEFDEALCTPDIIKKAIEAEQEGVDALIIDCMGDPGLKAFREAVSIPVLSPCQTSMHIARMLGHKFAFITVLDRIKPLIADLASTYGLNSSYGYFDAIDIPVLDLHIDMSELNKRLTDKAIDVIREKKADSIILGCTGFLGCAEAMRQGLSEAGFDVPVLDPIPITVNIADSLVKAKLNCSQVVYPKPFKKAIVGYNIPNIW